MFHKFNISVWTLTSIIRVLNYKDLFMQCIYLKSDIMATAIFPTDNGTNIYLHNNYLSALHKLETIRMS